MPLSISSQLTKAAFLACVVCLSAYFLYMDDQRTQERFGSPPPPPSTPDPATAAKDDDDDAAELARLTDKLRSLSGGGPRVEASAVPAAPKKPRTPSAKEAAAAREASAAVPLPQLSRDLEAQRYAATAAQKRREEAREARERERARGNAAAPAQQDQRSGDVAARKSARLESEWREAKYKDLVLVPGFEWALPTRPTPLCTLQPRTCDAPAPLIDQTALIGTLLDDAAATEVGSIMPRFEYRELPPA